MGRILAIDHGKARIGLAVSDPLGITTRPLPAVNGQDPVAAVKAIAAMVEEEEVDRVVLGMPFQMDGTEGPAVVAVRAFGEALKQALPDLPLDEVDERLTSRQAHAELKAGGMKHKKRKENVDSSAAMLMLRAWLDSHRG